MNLYVPPVFKPICRLVYLFGLITAVALFYVTRCRTSGEKLLSTSVKNIHIGNYKFKPRNYTVTPTPTGTLLKGLQKKTTPTSQKKLPLLLITYMRSGSTFTADILQQSPDVYYIYEPFKAMNTEFFKADEACRTITGKCRSSPTRTRRLLYDTFSILTCSIGKAQKKVIRKLKQTVKASKQHENFMQCLGHHKESQCIKVLEKNCTKKRVSMIKSIRLTIDFTRQLIKKMPHLKVIHLLRDPRGILQSRRHGGYLKLNNFSLAARVLCDRMTFDIRTAKALETKYPNQYLKVHYESLAQYPHLGAKRLYDFCGLPLTSTIKSYITNITHGSQNSGYFSTIRKDSSKVSSQWRQTLPFKYVKLIDSKCASFYELSGYNRIPSSHLLYNEKFQTLDIN